jgi:hypothetical protein
MTRYEYKVIRIHMITAPSKLEALFNDLGEQGFRLVGYGGEDNDLATFVREVPQNDK